MDDYIEQEEMVNILTRDSLRRCFAKWGIEKTEEKIYELCRYEVMRDCFLRNYKKLLKG